MFWGSTSLPCSDFDIEINKRKGPFMILYYLNPYWKTEFSHDSQLIDEKELILPNDAKSPLACKFCSKQTVSVEQAIEELFKGTIVI